MTETIDFNKVTKEVREENNLDSRYDKIKTKELAKESYESIGYSCK